MHKKSRTAGGVAESFIICLALSCLIIIVLSLISAAVLSSMADPTKYLGIFSLAAMLISALIAGICCARISKVGDMKFASLVALAVVLIMLLINVIATAGGVSGGAFMNYGCYFGVYILAAAIGRHRGHHTKHRKR